MSIINPLLLRAPAKINWTLEILGKRPDGYHQIDSLMQAVSLYDDLKIEPIGKRTCEIACDDADIPTDRRNLIWRAWDLMRREYPESVGGIRVNLIKRIPTGAGLGGGSSDAAATLIGINKIFGLRLRKIHLAEWAADIGSDVPFFIYGGIARAERRGDIITPIRSGLPAIYLVIAYPGFPSPTAEAYRKLRAAKFTEKQSRRTKTIRAMRAAMDGNREGLIRLLFNSFDLTVTKKDRRYALLKRRMAGVGLQSVMLSGSGSACFGLAACMKDARDAAKALQEYYPDCFAVRTLHKR